MNGKVTLTQTMDNNGHVYITNSGTFVSLQFRTQAHPRSHSHIRLVDPYNFYQPPIPVRKYPEQLVISLEIRKN